MERQKIGIWYELKKNIYIYIYFMKNNDEKIETRMME